MQRQSFAVKLVLVGLLVGLLGNIFFYDKAVGLSFPLYVLVIVAVLLATGRPSGFVQSVRKLWLLIPLLFFSVMIAVRADSQILGLNLLAVLALGALLLHYLPLRESHVDTDPLTYYVGGLIETGLYLLPGAGWELGDSWKWLREKPLKNYKALIAVGRGLLIAIPVLVVFAVLLASADLVFSNYLDRVWEALTPRNAEDLIGRGLMTGFLGWLAIGALAYGVARRSLGVAVPDAAVSENARGDEHEDAPEERPAKRGAKPFILGVIESGIILGSVDLLFGAFVLIQMAYLFGGQANISFEGYTYAQYARRGFFELVAVSILVQGLVLFLDWVTVRDGRSETTVFRALSVVIVGLTVVMLISASRRMWLYEEAYGFTHLRVYTHVFMVWLGILLVIFLLALFRIRQNIFSLGLILVTIGYLGTMNLLNVDRYIAERNIARWHDGQELDISYLSLLSADAVPAMVDLYNEASDPAIREGVGQWLAYHRAELAHLRDGNGSTMFSFNVDRERAWSLLSNSDLLLPEYDSYALWQLQNGYSSTREGYSESMVTPVP